MEVRAIDKRNRKMLWMLKHKHYAGIVNGFHEGCEPKSRIPQIVQAFGLFEKDDMFGCCVFSRPASYTLCKGVCGEEHKRNVLELSRLVILPSEHRNVASFFVSRSLKQLKDKPWIVVSYADTNEGHFGFVYQASNWLYTGQGNPEPWWRHPETKLLVSKTRRHIDKKAEKLGLHWKDFIKEKKQGKHRYVMFVGTKKQCKQLREALNYKLQPYPKGTSKRFDLSSSTYFEATLFGDIK